jgi:alkylresorcinol/alkylpyrone synthase
LSIAAIASAFPRHYYPQPELLDELCRQWRATPQVESRLRAFHERAGVDGRHLALPRERYAELPDFSARNREYQRVAIDLASEALLAALDQAELPATALDHVFFVSVTGFATPSIDAHLVNRLGLSRYVRRTPISGLGCVAGAAGLARAADWACAYPRANVALIAVELCSLTWQADDLSIPNLIASSLFGDGAVALVLRGDAPPGCGPRVLSSRAVFFPDTERVMGFDIGSWGMRIVLSAGVPDLVQRCIVPEVDAFLAAQGLTRERVDHWVLHTGGPRVLEAFEQSLALDREATALSWESLRRYGNLSSASVLLVLRETCVQRKPKPGSHGLLLAMGPGFCAEMVLLRW